MPDNSSAWRPTRAIVSVKVADADGATDVSQVIAAIDWVVQNRNANGLNIRVLNLSFGTDGVQDYQLDPLTYAAEVAWHAGIVVVVAAGNGGLRQPEAEQPGVRPVRDRRGRRRQKGTAATADDVVPAGRATGDGARNPDIVAPGARSSASAARARYLDTELPERAAWRRGSSAAAVRRRPRPSSPAPRRCCSSSARGSRRTRSRRC